MPHRFTIEVEHTEDGFIATSPEYPHARGRGVTLASAVAQLVDEIDRTDDFSSTTQGPIRSGELNGEGCESLRPEVKWTPSESDDTSITEKVPMPQHETMALSSARRRGRQVPGALEWIKEHADEYAGRWVAVDESGLVAAADSFEELRSQLASLQGIIVTQVT